MSMMINKKQPERLVDEIVISNIDTIRKKTKINRG